ncbi:MAG: hypothetical protein IH987_01335 [Planctomycetes bacterium]|nr:hypothetical protein [Planctomycetota bacterium]
MQPEIYATLAVRARQAMLVERMKTSAQLQTGRLAKDGLPDIALLPIQDAISQLNLVSARWKRECKNICQGEPVYEFVMSTIGLSEACFVFLGCAPPMIEFGNVAKAWKYCGLAPGQKKEKGKKAGFSPRLKSHAIARLAKPCMKMNGGRDKNGKKLPLSPYRPIYDMRRERTMFTHPPMREVEGECEYCDEARAYTKKLRASKNFERERTTVAKDCSAFNGIHWTDGHRDADAMRVMAKAIVRDLWLVENGLPPRLAHSAPEQPPIQPAALGAA